MANTRENALTVVDLDAKNAKAELDRLNGKLKELKQLQKDLMQNPILNDKQLKQTDRELAKVRNEMTKTKKETIDVSKVMNNLSGSSLRQLEAAYRKVSNARKEMSRTDPKFKQLESDQKRLKAEIDKTNGAFQKQNGMMSKLSGSFSKYSGMIMAGAASLTGVVMALRKATDYANEREEGMNYLQSLTGLSPEAVAEMEQMAIKASTSVIDGNIRIRQSADEIVAAYTVVGSQRPELLKNSAALHQVTVDAIILSNAAKMDLDPATRALTNTLNQFTLSADQSRRVINILAAGSQAGSADIEYLSEAIEKTGTTANLMNMSVEQTVGALEAIGPFYAEASMAGNSFDKVLLKMKAGNIGYVDGVFDLNTAILEMESRFAAGESAVDLFGVEHAKMAELLVQNREQVINYTDAVTGSNKAIEQASINTNNNASKLDQAKNMAKEYAIELGKKLQPALAGIVSKGALLMKFLSNSIDMFIKYKGIIIPVVGAIATYWVAQKAATIWTNAVTVAQKVGAIATKLYHTAVALATGNLKAATAAQKAFNIAGKANVWGLIAAAIVAAATAITLYVRHAKSSVRIQKDLADAHKSAAESVAAEKTEMDSYLRIAKDSNKSLEERKEAIARLNEISPEYLGGLTLETINTSQATEAVEKYTKSLKEKARAQAMESVMSTKYADVLKLELEIEEAGKKYGWGNSKVLSLQNKRDKLEADIEKIESDYNKKYGAKSAAPTPLDATLKSNFDMLDKLLQKAQTGDAASIAELNKILGSTFDTTDINWNDGSGFLSAYTTLQKHKLDLIQLQEEKEKAAKAAADKVAADKAAADAKAKSGVSGNTNSSSSAVNTIDQKDLAQELFDRDQYTESMLQTTGKDWADYLVTRKSQEQSYIDWKIEQNNLYAEYYEALIDDDAKLWSVYLTNRKSEDQSYLEWKNTYLYDQQAKANKDAADEELYNLEMKLAKGEITEKQYAEELLITKLAILMQEKALREAHGLDTTEIAQSIADAELEIEKDKFAKIQEQRAKDAEDYKKKADKVLEITSTMSEAVGKVMGDANMTIAEKRKALAKELLKISLTELRNQLALAIAGAMLKEVGTKGFIGLGTGAALSVALGAAYGLAMAKLEGFQTGGHTGYGNSSDVAGVVHKKEYVIPESGTSNPSLARIINVIEAARVSNNLKSVDFDTLMQMPSLRAGDSPSNFQQNSLSSASTDNDQISNVLAKFIQTNGNLNATINKLSYKLDNLEATISYDKQKLSDKNILNAQSKARLNK